MKARGSAETALKVFVLATLVIPLAAFASTTGRMNHAPREVDCAVNCSGHRFTPMQSGVLRMFAAEFDARSARRDSLAIETLSRRPRAQWRFHASQRSCKDALSELGSCDEASRRDRDIQRKPVAFPGDR